MVVIRLAGGRTQVREIRTSDGYLSAGPPIAYFGLGKATIADVTVRFSGGTVVSVKGARAGTRLTVKEPR